MPSPRPSLLRPAAPRAGAVLVLAAFPWAGAAPCCPCARQSAAPAPASPLARLAPCRGSEPGLGSGLTWRLLSQPSRWGRGEGWTGTKHHVLGGAAALGAVLRAG